MHWPERRIFVAVVTNVHGASVLLVEKSCQKNMKI